MTVVLDASAVLAMLREEPGGDKVIPVLRDALICSVNLAEVADHYATQGADRVNLRAFLGKLPVRVVLADTDLAIDAALLKPLTRVAGLSLGDRYCLALGARESLPVLTTDRIWARVADAVGVTIEVIR